MPGENNGKALPVPERRPAADHSGSVGRDNRSLKKHMDSRQHRKFTSAANELILQKIVETAKNDIPLIVRIPVIFGHNDDEKNIRAGAKFIAAELGKNVLQVQLLSYRPVPGKVQITGYALSNG
ncbi:MAG: 4-hydroxyphenylacetate decarboxylase activating enzyme [Syntrophomonadaceae bacterium]|nr:4-hydroxyphenylacetate decarboxylase activating enzyme [Bacillota bacterium]